MDKSTLEFYLIGDAHPDALGLLCGFSFQRGKAGHGSFGGKDLLQLGADLRVRRGEDGAAILVGQDAGLKGIDMAGGLDDLGLIHADERAQDGQILGSIGALQGLDGLAMRIMLRRISTVNSTSGALSRMYSWGFV